VVHFVANVGGGVWSVVKTLAAQHRPRWRVMLVAVQRGQIRPSFVAEAEQYFDRAHLICRPSIKGIYYLAPPRVTGALKALGLDPGAQRMVYHFHGGPYSPWVFRLPRRPPPGKWFAWFNGSRGNFGDTRNRLKLWLHVAGLRIMQKRGFTLVAVSQRSAQDCAAMYGVRRADFQVVYNGTPLAVPALEPAPRPGRPFRVGFAGTVMPAKGWRKVVAAVAQLRGEGLNVCCRLAGDGPDYPALRQLAAQHPDWLQALGHVPQPQRDLYPSLDALVVPSDFEGHPLVILEALSCGVPCLCADVGGCAETVRDDQEGYILRENSPAEIARRLKQLVLGFGRPEDAGNGRWATLSGNCLARHRELFTAQRMAESWEQLYLAENATGAQS